MPHHGTEPSVKPGNVRLKLALERLKSLLLPATLIPVTFPARQSTSLMGIGMRSALAGMASAWMTLANPPQNLEVSSVKASHTASAESNVDSVRGRLTATNITVRELIRLAYGVRDYQIERAPGWVDAERFDIVAKSVSSTSNSMEDLKSLVRELLASRFQLATHRESRQASLYLLVAAKDGPKLAAHNDAAPKARGGCGRLLGRGVTADAIATILSRQLDREVVNRTALSGEYDFQLNFTPDSGPCAPNADSDPPGRPSLYAAVQEQLGLKLEPAKGPVEFLVIDRVNRPSEN